MKIVTTWDDLNKIPWDSVFKCAKEYKERHPGDNHDYYNDYMKSTWGIDHSIEHVRVIDEQKYTMFLLRWA